MALIVFLLGSIIASNIFGNFQTIQSESFSDWYNIRMNTPSRGAYDKYYFNNPCALCRQITSFNTNQNLINHILNQYVWDAFTSLNANGHFKNIALQKENYGNGYGENNALLDYYKNTNNNQFIPYHYITPFMNEFLRLKIYPNLGSIDVSNAHVVRDYENSKRLKYMTNDKQFLYMKPSNVYLSVTKSDHNRNITDNKLELFSHQNQQSSYTTNSTENYGPYLHKTKTNPSQSNIHKFTINTTKYTRNQKGANENQKVTNKNITAESKNSNIQVKKASYKNNTGLITQKIIGTSQSMKETKYVNVTKDIHSGNVIKTKHFTVKKHLNHTAQLNHSKYVKKSSVDKRSKQKPHE